MEALNSGKGIVMEVIDVYIFLLKRWSLVSKNKYNAKCFVHD
jgi:hypothetical protein